MVIIAASFGEVAQLGERVVRNDEVGSSILLFSTIQFRLTILGRAFLFVERQVARSASSAKSHCAMRGRPTVS